MAHVILIRLSLRADSLRCRSLVTSPKRPADRHLGGRDGCCSEPILGGSEAEGLRSLLLPAAKAAECPETSVEINPARL